MACAGSSISGQRSGRLGQHDRRPARTADAGGVQAGALVGHAARARVDAQRAVVGHAVEVPALVPQRLGSRCVGALVRGLGRQRLGRGGVWLGQQLQRAQVQHLLAHAREAGLEHAVAALGLHDHDPGGHVQQQAVECSAAIPLPALVPGQALHALIQQPLVVAANQLLLVGAAVLHVQPGAQEVGHVGHGRPPHHGLPVDRGAGAVGEQQVVQPVVAVHQPQRRPGVRVPAVERRQEALHDRGVLVGHPVRVALAEGRPELGQELLRQRVGLVQPVRRAQRQVAEHRSVDARQRVQRQPRLVHRAARDLIALDGAHHVVEHQREPALARVVGGQVAARHGVAEPLGQVLVEGDLAVVGAHAHARAAAGGVVGGQLDHHGLEGAAVALKVARKFWLIWPVPIRSVERSSSAGAIEHAAQPVGADLVRCADQRVRRQRSDWPGARPARRRPCVRTAAPPSSSAPWRRFTMSTA